MAYHIAFARGASYTVSADGTATRDEGLDSIIGAYLLCETVEVFFPQIGGQMVHAPAPSKYEGKNIAIVDCVFNLDIMKDIVRKCKTLTFFSAKSYCAPTISYLSTIDPSIVCLRYDQTKISTARLIWHITGTDMTAPWYVKTMYDGTLTRDIELGMKNRIPAVFTETKNDVRLRGEAISSTRISSISSAVAAATSAKFEDKYSIVTCTCSHELTIDVLNALVTVYPACDFVVVWSYDLASDRWFLVLRKVKVDVIPIVIKYKGNPSSGVIELPPGKHMRTLIS